MKTTTTLALLLAFASFSQAEEVEVFACDTKSHDIEWGEPGVEETTSFLTFHRVGKSVGKIDTGKVSLGQFAADAAAYDSSSDPFFGPGVNYIVKDGKGHHFILFFEYEKGHRTFNGFRMAINKVSLIDPKLGVYEGRPYAGTSFDKSILAQLKEITDK
ncbi:MAG: hypothetical protein EOP84_01915 [Verrucomicrobiaceae bacterium]|nr:MAG: hypothetical protein EOP84_01915 [Verrucomicrobiaceae bacterium]